MNSGLYTAYSGLIARYDSLNVVSNNLANINTSGYKEDKLFYTLYRNALIQERANPLETAINSGVIIENPATDFSPGNIMQTGNTLDLAINGKGFFALQTPNGTRYTRNGSLTVDAARKLVTQDGLAVLGENGPITLPEGEVNVDALGAINAEGLEVDRLKIVDFERYDGLRKEGGSRFVQTDPNSREIDATETEIRQGFVEKSNVDGTRILVDMMETLRQFQSIEKSIDLLMNDINVRVIEQVARPAA